MKEEGKRNKPSLCILAGEGSLPALVALKALIHYEILIVGIKGISDSSIEKFNVLWLPSFQASKILQAARKCKNFVVIGRFRRSLIKHMSFDWAFLRFILPAMRALMGGDDHFSKWVISVLKEKYDIDVVGIQAIAPELLAPEGCLTHYQPSEQNKQDIAKARELIKSISHFDVGQAVVVSCGRIIAIEAADGTNAMLEHVQAIAPLWSYTRKGAQGVFVKMPKVQQERTVDLPVIGVETIEKVFQAGLSGLAVEANGVIISHIDDVIKKANECRLFIQGF
jgi:UDP-2,3-diacylglucosamine hydrolase